ncbi:hypothetical protein DRJ17_05935, partial [Candidatus Woesearchaeota archaeon]
VKLIAGAIIFQSTLSYAQPLIETKQLNTFLKRNTHNEYVYAYNSNNNNTQEDGSMTNGGPVIKPPEEEERIAEEALRDLGVVPRKTIVLLITFEQTEIFRDIQAWLPSDELIRISRIENPEEKLQATFDIISHAVALNLHTPSATYVKQSLELLGGYIHDTSYAGTPFRPEENLNAENIEHTEGELKANAWRFTEKWMDDFIAGLIGGAKVLKERIEDSNEYIPTNQSSFAQNFANASITIMLASGYATYGPRIVRNAIADSRYESYVLDKGLTNEERFDKLSKLLYEHAEKWEAKYYGPGWAERHRSAFNGVWNFASDIYIKLGREATPERIAYYLTTPREEDGVIPLEEYFQNRKFHGSYVTYYSIDKLDENGERIKFYDYMDEDFIKYRDGGGEYREETGWFHDMDIYQYLDRNNIITNKEEVRRILIDTLKNDKVTKGLPPILATAFLFSGATHEDDYGHYDVLLDVDTIDTEFEHTIEAEFGAFPKIKGVSTTGTTVEFKLDKKTNERIAKEYIIPVELDADHISLLTYATGKKKRPSFRVTDPCFKDGDIYFSLYSSGEEKYILLEFDKGRSCYVPALDENGKLQFTEDKKEAAIKHFERTDEEGKCALYFDIAFLPEASYQVYCGVERGMDYPLKRVSAGSFQIGVKPPPYTVPAHPEIFEEEVKAETKIASAHLGYTADLGAIPSFDTDEKRNDFADTFADLSLQVSIGNQQGISDQLTFLEENYAEGDVFSSGHTWDEVRALFATNPKEAFKIVFGYDLDSSERTDESWLNNRVADNLIINPGTAIERFVPRITGDMTITYRSLKALINPSLLSLYEVSVTGGATQYAPEIINMQGEVIMSAEELDLVKRYAARYGLELKIRPLKLPVLLGVKTFIRDKIGEGARIAGAKINWDKEYDISTMLTFLETAGFEIIRVEEVYGGIKIKKTNTKLMEEIENREYGGINLSLKIPGGMLGFRRIIVGGKVEEERRPTWTIDIPLPHLEPGLKASIYAAISGGEISPGLTGEVELGSTEKYNFKLGFDVSVGEFGVERPRGAFEIKVIIERKP